MQWIEQQMNGINKKLQIATLGYIFFECVIFESKVLLKSELQFAILIFLWLVYS